VEKAEKVSKEKMMSFKSDKQRKWCFASGVCKGKKRGKWVLKNNSYAKKWSEKHAKKVAESELNRMYVDSWGENYWANRPDREQAIENAKKVFEDAKIYISVPTYELEKIMKDGRIKNQFELGGFCCEKEAQKRREAAERLLGVPTKRAAQYRPVYGFWATDEKSFRTVSFFTTNPALTETSVLKFGFGDVLLKMKDSIKERTSLTMRDSFVLERDGISPIAKNRYVASFWPQLRPDPLIKEKKYRGNHNDWVDVAIEGWTEAQIHGGATTKDIEAILIQKRPDKKSSSWGRGWVEDRDYDKWVKSVKEVGKRYGIPVKEVDLDPFRKDKE